jgi:RNA polymerase sigma-70 factor (ECF subfamily)
VTLHDPAHLLDHAAWLRTLAQSLVGDRATADDLVQDTYVAALGRPPSMDRPVNPWLSRVLRNAARFRWRSETNRSTREAALARTAERETLTSAELLERHETQQMLARLVGELEEPYREVILLRFAEGLAPKDIGHRLGVPAGTVRWRIYARRRRHPHRFGHRGVTGRTPEYGEVARPHTCAYDAHV